MQVCIASYAWAYNSLFCAGRGATDTEGLIIDQISRLELQPATLAVTLPATLGAIAVTTLAWTSLPCLTVSLHAAYRTVPHPAHYTRVPQRGYTNVTWHTIDPDTRAPAWVAWVSFARCTHQGLVTAFVPNATGCHIRSRGR